MPDYSKLPKGLTSLLKGAENAAPAVNRLDMNFKDVTKRIPKLTDAANMVARGEMTAGQYDSLVRKLKPVTPYDFVPKPATAEEAINALSADAKSSFGVPSKTLKAGDPVGLRLDIPAYRDYGVWVPTVHEQASGFGAGKKVGHENVAAVKNPQFGMSPKAALSIATGKPKGTIATIKGEWNPINEKDAVARAQEYLNHPDWRQVGMDPERHSYFYDRSTMAPVIGADEVIQIGPLVLAKKPRYGKPEDFPFKKGGAIKMQVGGLSKLAKGLMPTARIKLPAPEIIVPSKLSNVQEAVRKMKGNYGARRVERAADEIPNLDKLYKEEALKQAFLGDNAKAVMTMNPKDFEKYAAPLDPRFMDANSTRYTTSGERLTYPDYMSEYLPNVGAFNDVPFLEINKKIQGLSIPPFISGHEGRHRNRVMANKGEEAGLVLLNPRTELREPFPRRSQEEYIEALKKELEMTGNKVVPEKNFEQKDIKRPAIDLPDIYAKGGAIHMQVGGLSALANIGKATKAGSKLSAAEMAALRASGLEVPGVHFADSLNPNDIMRMSEALGAAGAEGKTLNLTQADRSRVYGPNKGGTGFSGLQLTSPAHQQAGSTWGVGKKGHVSRLTNATSPDTIWSTFIGSPTQHMSNPVTVERMYEAHRKANPSAELVGKMNDSLNSAVNKKGNLVFPNGIDLSDPSSLNQAQTFDQRKLVAKALVMGGQKKGEQAARDAFKIIQEETDPLLMDSPTYAVGNRLFTIDKNSGLYRPDLNSAFPYITTGTDMGLLFEPAPVEHAIPGFVKQFANRLNKNGELQPMGHKDLTATTPSVFVDYKYLTDLQKEGYKDGGSAELPPFHDFDKIMQRKDGGTVNTFEQRLKGALEQHMAVGGMVDRHYADAGTVTAPTTQELENMADSQGAAFGFFPQMAKKSFQQQTPTMDRASEMLKAQITKEWEQAGRPGGAKELALRIGALTAGQGGDLLNFAQTVIPSLYDEKPTSVLESGKKPPAPYRDTRELQRIPKFPMTGSPEIKQSMREKGMINEDEYPLFELAGAIGAPMALSKAPKAIKGGLNATRSGLENTAAAVRNPFQPATLTMEQVAPDLGQLGGDKFKDLLTRRLTTNEGAPVSMSTMGGRKTDKTLGQGLYENKAGVFETNPMVGVNIPRAGNLSTNKKLLADIGTAGQELGQEMVAAHKFTPLLFGNSKDATAMMVRGADGAPLNKKQIIELAGELPGMIATHSPKAGGMFVAPFEGDALDYARVQKAASKILGKNAQIKFGKADPSKDILYRGDYAAMGARPPSAESIAMRDRLKKAEARIVRGPSKSQPASNTQPPSLTSTLRSAP
jgi:hypothetical protein